MEVRTRKITFGLTFTLLLAVALSTTFIVERQNLDNRSKADEIDNRIKDLSTIPIVSSSAPTQAQVGKEYRYILRISDNDTPPENIKVDIKRSPSWLVLQDNIVLAGIPSIGDLGMYRVTLLISDGTNIVEENFNIEVIE